MAADAMFGYEDSKSSSPLSFTDIPNLDYSSDFAVAEQTAKQVIMVNTTTPVDQVESLKFSIQDVNNIYANTNIDPTLYAPSKKGKSVVCSLQDTARITNSTTNTHVDYPIKAHFVLQFPVSTSISASDMLKVAKRMFALAFNGANTNARLNELMRGVMKPGEVAASEDQI